ncbi:M43 family zinc metalloprotease, partial [Arthrobacter sp. YD4]|uniref:M43 family zinc metalloprotease n=2 Tax=unclassified Arthrobacter TaxID=235627 RepID=UPI0025B324D2
MARTGNIKVRLVTVQLTDVKANISMDSAVSAVQATSNYWATMSNGRLSMSVASTETFNSRSASSTQRYSDMMNTITNELGWVPNPYTALVVFVSTPTLSDGAYGAGWSYNGTSGRVIMPLPAALTRSVLTHEFGHVLGLMHANSLQCGSGAQDVATNSDGTFADPSCSIREYGDSMDLMGVSQSSQPTISSTLWEYGGFGTGREVRDLGKAGNSTAYTLTAWSGTADGRAVKFTDPVSGEVYYLELRLPVGYDAATAVNGNRGVKIVQQLGAGSLILMPDSHPFAGYYSTRHAWQAGEVFTTHAGTRVTVNWISGTAAGVTIESTAAMAVKAIADVAAVSPGLGKSVSGLKTGLRGGVSQGFENGAIYWTA